MADPHDDEDLVARISELARQAWQAQLQAARRSLDAGRDVLTSNADPVTAGRAWADAASRESAEYWKDVTALGIEATGRLVTLWSHSVARVLAETQAATHRGRRVLHDSDADAGGGADWRTGRAVRERTSAGDAHVSRTTSDPVVAERGPMVVEAGPDLAESGPVVAQAGPDPAGGAEARPHPSVTLRAGIGEIASGTVLLANTHPRARRVTLAPSDLRGPTGESVALVLLVDPPSVTIPAGAEQSVDVSVDLTADVAEPGARYTGTLDVRGGVDAVIDVIVDVA